MLATLDRTSQNGDGFQLRLLQVVAQQQSVVGDGHVAAEKLQQLARVLVNRLGESHVDNAFTAGLGLEIARIKAVGMLADFVVQRLADGGLHFAQAGCSLLHPPAGRRMLG